MINFKKMTQIKEDDKYEKVDIKIIQLLERLQVGTRSLSYFYVLWKLGGDRFRRDKKDIELHAEDYSSLRKYLLQ